jgi:DNA-directed RNA polymerase subunit RPC12/RpoP
MIDKITCPYCEHKTYYEFLVSDVDDIVFVRCDKCKHKILLEFEFKPIARSATNEKI